MELKLTDIEVKFAGDEMVGLMFPNLCDAGTKSLERIDEMVIGLVD